CYMWLSVFFLALSIGMTSSAVAAAEAPTLWSLRIANDSFFAQDRGYTSGVQLEVHPADSPFSFYLGQDLFTPEENSTRVPPEGQHPYGAWLYLGGDYRKQLKPNLLLTSSLILGTTGERALGEEAQDVTHTVLKFKEYDGWDSQISERWGWILRLKLDGRLPVWEHENGVGLDLVGHLEGRGGNIYVDTAVGATLRVGLNIPELETAYSPQTETSLYFSAGYDIRAVDRNVFLEGVRRSDYAVIPQRTYDRFRAGVHWRRDPYRVDLDFYIPQEYFTTQDLNCRYGVLRLSYWL
ncbi:MAG: lipid A-modifier LpxR family protein, partial [Desulfuromonadaceae bacterium]